MEIIKKLTADGRLKSTSKKFDKNAIIFLEGDAISKICILESGSVRCEKAYPDGEVHIVDVFQVGDVFALEIAASRTRKSAMDYIANEDTRVRFVSMAAIEKSEYEAEIRREITHRLADENVRMAHKLEILAERGLRDRILTYLRVLQGKAGTDTVSVPMSREQMAQFLCVNRSALSNELNIMKREGIIDFKGSRFTIN
ncbi:MAG: Crp/Fnr family transcriptional regulator [Bacillota bacterium]|nr:Crp/Fnr family transcriptional regulator [Bacillota bacterium]